MALFRDIQPPRWDVSGYGDAGVIQGEAFNALGGAIGSAVTKHREKKEADEIKDSLKRFAIGQGLTETEADAVSKDKQAMEIAFQLKRDETQRKFETDSAQNQLVQRQLDEQERKKFIDSLITWDENGNPVNNLGGMTPEDRELLSQNPLANKVFREMGGAWAFSAGNQKVAELKQQLELSSLQREQSQAAIGASRASSLLNSAQVKKIEAETNASGTYKIIPAVDTDGNPLPGKHILFAPGKQATIITADEGTQDQRTVEEMTKQAHILESPNSTKAQRDDARIRLEQWQRVKGKGGMFEDSWGGKEPTGPAPGAGSTKDISDNLLNNVFNKPDYH